MTEQRDPRRIFISHDTRDADVALKFKKMIRLASGGGLKGFVASDVAGRDTIPYGDDWNQRIHTELATTGVLIVLLTRESMSRPWVYYEVGLARAAQAVRVIGVRLDADLKEEELGPLQTEQMPTANEGSLFKMLKELIQSADGDPQEEIIVPQIREFLSQMEESANRPGRDSSGEEAAISMNRQRVGAVEDLLFGEATLSDAARWLAASSICFEAIPWLETPSVALHKALASKDRSSEKRATAEVREAIEAVSALVDDPDSPVRLATVLITSFLDELPKRRDEDG